MVRMVHMNILYKMDLQVNDPTNQFLMKTEKLGFWKMINLVVGPNIDFLSLFSRPNFWAFDTFWATNLKIYPVEYVHMDHTDHFGFR